MNRYAISLALAFGVMATACDDNTPTDTTKPWALGQSMPRFAVRSSDYSVSSIGLLDAQGNSIADGWLTSGSTAPGLTAALSGDNDFPTEMEPGVLTIIDRFQHDVVTRIEYSTGTILGQLRTQGQTTTAAFSSNPQDVAYLSATSAWVSRYTPNADPAAAGDVKGNDLLEIDPATMSLTGRRIDLSPLDVTVMVDGASGPVSVVTYARPVRIVQTGSHLVVGLDRISDDFSATGPGAFAVVDPAGGTAVAHALDGLANCGHVQPVPGTTDTVLVRCLGGYEDVVPRAGLVVATIAADGTVTEKLHYVLADHATVQPFLDSVLALSDHEVLGTHVGGWMPDSPPDTLYFVDLATDTQTTLLTSKKASDFFVSMAYDPSSGLVLVPDQTAGIHRLRFDPSTHATTVVDVFAFGHAGLPVVSVALLP